MARIVVVDREKCNPTGCGEFCIKKCPMNRAGKECIIIQDGKAVVDEKICTGCGICTKCPLEAIHVINLPEALENPIHRYGKNGFALYSLPTPIFGKVIGILGVNGIGKSTALKILVGLLKPNLGKENKEASYKELIEFFKGTEAQLFFEKLHKGKIKIGYKPQQVDLIAKTQKGKVKDLLKKVDEKKEIDRISKLLGIEKILDSDISRISGGELQRVAIAATVLKKANLYIFDEPTSYLDIKQRVKVSKFVKGLADEKTAVIVVEHDLIILDYMTDLVHLMYGKEGAYGIVSQPKTAKTAINTYLEGYLKDENIRFRDHEIKFEAKPPLKQKQGSILCEWKDIEKRLGKFHLKSGQGTVYKNDVVGILGENGIGKTTFVRILAEDIKADKGSINKKVKVSYKPQYIQSDSEELVMNVLQEAVKKYNNQLIIPLKIKSLLLKQINQLSGGEIQRVAIAICLSKDADLYLLDEPSAYLDIEQRLIISRIIRNLMELKGKTALVVDHDLLFIDYISKKLIVFEGIPAEQGEVKGPFSMEDGMNNFLKDLDITFRRDKESNRPRINKEDSLKDREQKAKGKYYYS